MKDRLYARSTYFYQRLLFTNGRSPYTASMPQLLDACPTHLRCAEGILVLPVISQAQHIIDMYINYFKFFISVIEFSRPILKGDLSWNGLHVRILMKKLGVDF